MDKWMKNNNFNKILALAIGIVLWTMVHIDGESTSPAAASMSTKIIENVKIEVSGFDEDKYVLDSKDADSVRMEVSGKSSDIMYVFSDAYRVTLDLSDAKPGTMRIPLSYSLPNGVRLISMTPQEVNVHIELRNTKSFPVSVATKGEPAEGYQLGTPVIQPVGTAEVTLSASELSKVAKVQGTIELDGENETFKEKRMKLAAYDSAGNEIKGAVIEPSTVSVELPITLPFKSVPLDIGFTGQLPSSLVLSRVTPELESVVVYGYKDSLAAITSYEAMIDLSTIKAAGTNQVEIKLTPPAGTEKIEPDTVNVMVSASEIAERTVEGIPVILQGLGSGLEGTVTNPASGAVTLTLSGAPALLDQLDRNKISVVADVSGLIAGTHEVSLQVSLPKFIALSHSGERLVATVQLKPPATPAASATPSANSGSTPEPSSAPVSGEGSPSGVQPTHSGTDPVMSPAPSASNENSGAFNQGESTGNTNNKAGT
ncbi:CdaR family protein [Paenibacillus sp. BR2-3]|uniref:CdaR family protein n=1 Tax=Paenibacillus sp. BR2-3 TaxID=3048494 RepID=UPI0039779EF3